jgi:hypothetical protein
MRAYKMVEKASLAIENSM